MAEVRSHSVELPSDLSSLVLEKLQSRFNSNPGARNALQNLLALGLVSKAWKSAIFKYSGNLLIEPVRQDDLLKVVKTLPDIQELRVESNSAQHFPHLSAFTGLTRLDYQAIRYGRENEEIDIDLLPPSLIDLTLSNCRINSASLNKLESFKLTSLKLRQIENTASEQYRLLQGLPNLQRLAVRGNLPASYFASILRPEATSLRALEELCIYEGSLFFPLERSAQATALKKLDLYNVHTTATQLAAVCAGLTSLTSLMVSGCQDPDEGREPSDEFPPLPQSVPGLRSLRLQSVPWRYIQLAGPDLVSLEVTQDDDRETEEQPQESILGIASLTALTRLSLGFYQFPSSLSALQDLQLKELHLVECSGAAAAILTPKMTSLQKLHIWERMERNKDGPDDVAETESVLATVRQYETLLKQGRMTVKKAADEVKVPRKDLPYLPDYLPEYEPSNLREADELDQLGLIVLSLPKLHDISGSCPLFSYSLKGDLKEWSVWNYKDEWSNSWEWKKIA